jgi:hypothetical protein
VLGAAAEDLAKHEVSVTVFELVAAAALVSFGVGSLLRWRRTDFESTSARDQILYTLHVTARVGMWFVFAGFFAGYALVDEPQRIRWYILVPVGLAGLQLMTGIFLSREPSAGGTDPPGSGAGVGGRRSGNTSPMGRGRDTPESQPGPLRDEKVGESAEPSSRQPEAAEVESARLLANQAGDALRQVGMTDEEIRRTADDWVAQDRGDELDAFVEWARRTHGDRRSR